MLAVSRLTDFDHLKQMREEWNQLVERSQAGHVLLTHEWITTWWTYFGEGADLWVILVRDGDRLLAAAPLMRTRRRLAGASARCLGFMLSPLAGNKQSDLILGERAGEAVAEMVRHWEETAGDWDLIDLDGMSEASATVPLMERAIEGSTLRSVGPERSRSLYHLCLQGSWEEFLRGRTHNFRKSLAAARRRLARNGAVRFRRFTSPAEIDGAMDMVYAIERNSWKAKAGTAAALDARLSAFYRETARVFSRRGECEIRTVEVDGAPVASTLCLVHDGVVWGLKNSFDGRYAGASPGMAAFGHLIEDGWARGVREIEFNGDRDYLARWTAGRKQFRRVVICSRRPYSKLLGCAHVLRRSARSLVRRCRQRLAPAQDAARAGD